jgi:porphobilinogen synthase
MVMIIAGDVENDSTNDALVKWQYLMRKQSADFVAHHMMDGRVSRLRQGLDAAGFQNVGIMSYSAKCFGVLGHFVMHFRQRTKEQVWDTKDKKPKWINPIEAIKEALWDVEEGADMVMVKPELPI